MMMMITVNPIEIIITMTAKIVIATATQIVVMKNYLQRNRIGTGTENLRSSIIHTTLMKMAEENPMLNSCVSRSLIKTSRGSADKVPLLCQNLPNDLTTTTTWIMTLWTGKPWKKLWTQKQQQKSPPNRAKILWNKEKNSLVDHIEIDNTLQPFQEPAPSLWFYDRHTNKLHH